MLLRHLSVIGLILLFALGQTGALLHPLTHTADSINTSSSAFHSAGLSSSGEPSAPPPSSQAHSSICEKCLAYSQLAQALCGMPLLIAALSAVSVLAQDLYRTFTPALLTAFAARAPPAPVASRLF